MATTPTQAHNAATVAAFLALLPPATREQIMIVAEKHDFERFGDDKGVLHAVTLICNVAQHRTMSGYEIAASANALNYTDRENKKQRKEAKISFELETYEACVRRATILSYTLSGVVNRVIKASGIYRPFRPTPELDPLE